MLALFAQRNLAIILRAPWGLTVILLVPCSPEEHRKIAGFWDMASVDTCSCTSLSRCRFFTFFHVKWDPEVGSNLFVRNAWFDSGCEYCVSHGAFGGYFRIFYVQVVLGP